MDDLISRKTAIEAYLDADPEATFTEILNSVPTVNAIPVEWLNEMKRLAADYGDNECVNVIEYLFVRWQEEQEDK